jgi:acetyl esterase/lipase
MLKMKNKLTLLALLLALAGPVAAQQDSLYLWPGAVPYDLPGEQPETVTHSKNPDTYLVRNVQKPLLKVFLPPPGKANGASIIICPGGGYWLLAVGHEGDDFARWFAQQGVTAFVLKYRLPNERLVDPAHMEIVPLLDAQQAVRLVRRQAARWQLRPDRIGIMGFSAGGHLAATVGTQFRRVVGGVADTTSVRPDLMVLVYPVISFRDNYGHLGSRDNLLGKDPSTELIDLYSNELQVTPQVPPTFLLHTADDPVKVQNSVNFFLALQKHKVPAELHVYEKGGHGYGLAAGKPGLDSWPDRLRAWLRLHGWVE